MRGNAKKIIPGAAAVLAALLYVIWFSRTGIGIPCLFRLVTGLKCPGCGVTHMCVSLLKRDLPAARAANPFLFFTMPVPVFLALGSLRTRKSRLFDRILSAVLYTYLALLLLFGVLRNVL